MRLWEQKHDGENMTALPAVTATITSLPGLVDRAISALANARTSAEVLEARDMAGVIYDVAKKAARLGKAKKAHDELIAAAYRTQADALEIEAQAKRRLADEYDTAQEGHQVARSGDNQHNKEVVPNGNDLGLSRKEIHEARMIRNAEVLSPGVVRQTVDAALESGEEPTKTKVRAAVLQVVQADATTHRGPRLSIPVGALVSEHIRPALEMEKAGETAENCAKQAGIGVLSYRQARDIVLLSERTDLTEADAQRVRRALAVLDESAQTIRASEIVKPVVERIWGGRGARRFGATEQRRSEQFHDAISVIIESCAHGPQIAIPHLSSDARSEVVDQLKLAEKNIRELRERIKGGGI